MARLAVPSGPARIALGAAAAAWAGAAVGLRWGWWAVAAALVLGAVSHAAMRRPIAVLLAGALVAATASGALASERRAATLRAQVPAGHQTVAGRVHTDPQPLGGGNGFLLTPSHLAVAGEWRRWDGPRINVVVDREAAVVAGQRARVSGLLAQDSRVLRNDAVAGRMRADRVEALGPASDPLFRIGNMLRARVAGGLDRYRPDPAATLLAGFLIGDVRDLPVADEEALRRAGLTHYVAVSGSNVALFLAAWWLAAGPLAAGPRSRATLGLAGLAVFVVVTRWEPSVMRAATMAGLVLTGRLVAIPLDAWTALGAAVTLLLAVSAELAFNPGFQLSVAATGGVIAGARVFAGRRPRWAWSLLGATASAQLAVAPLLLWHFGKVPLMAPIANLAAGPLVAAATTLGGIGLVTGLQPLVAAGVVVSRFVLAVARLAAEWPQLGVVGAAGIGTAVGAMAVRRVRPVATLAVALATAMLVVGPVGPPAVPTAVFLDVGQGDAVLLLGPAGASILVDGGPDPARLLDALRRHGVRRIDLMVASHGHADHVTGLIAAVGSVPVGRLWHAGHRAPGLGAELLAAAAAHGIPADAVHPGWTARVGAFRIEVLGPLRRYASLNDESVVLWVEAGDRTVLLPGDVEAIAQSELGPLRADVLKVPHQGAATTDPSWLRASAGEVAVISVGPNRFGHPSADVIETLRAAGADLRRTDDEGDVVVPLQGTLRR